MRQLDYVLILSYELFLLVLFYQLFSMTLKKFVGLTQVLKVGLI